MAEPIIIVGAARSGTKFLRDVLGAAEGVSFVPYDVNYVWRYGAEDVSHDVLDPTTLTDVRKEFIRKTLPSLAKARKGDVLIEKTVSNTLRLPFVHEVFPNARYVHLIRDGRDVAESAMRQWEAPPNWSALFTKLRGMPLANIGYVFWFARNFIAGRAAGRNGGNVWGPRFPGIEEIEERDGLAAVCAQQWVESVAAAHRDLMAMPRAQGRVFEIRYDDLIRDESALRTLTKQLDLPDAETIMAEWWSRVRPPAEAQWSRLSNVDQETFKRVMGPTLTAMGY